MNDNILRRFIVNLSSQAVQPLLKNIDASIRFDVLADNGGTRHWTIRIQAGKPEVLDGSHEADCILRIAEPDLAAVILRRDTLIATYLRGSLHVEGDPKWIFLALRLMPRAAIHMGGKSTC